ncbi:MAG: hypothetical protein CMJ64_18165 [Planctomycetaceae bacterium]|nr:hypothetical protein [Planctomycetaceae bacterium]
MSLFNRLNTIFRRLGRAKHRHPEEGASDPAARAGRRIDAEQLEDRVLFNAAPIDLAAVQDIDAFHTPDTMHDALEALAETAHAQYGFAHIPEAPGRDDLVTEDASQFDDVLALEPDAAASESSEIVFIDRSVEDYQTLVNDLQSSSKADRFDIVFIEQDADGIEQVTRALAERGNYDAIHIVSHGNDRGLRLGETWLSGATLEFFQEEIATWGESLSDSGDLLFYGCDLAESAEGRALLESVSELCDCDVAASTDDTGSAELGGDWELEFHTGSIEAQIAVSIDGQIAWNHILALPTYAGNSTLAAGTGAITPALPAGIQVDDVLLGFFETHQETVTIVNPNGGTWTQVSNSPQGSGIAGANSSSRLTVFWSVYNGTQGAPTTNDPGDHVSGFIAGFRGVDTSDPIDVTSGSAAVSISGATTTVNDSLVVIAATAEDDSDAFSNWVNASLANMTERFERVHAQGDQGLIGIATGELAVAGAYGASTTTLTPSGERWGGMTISLASAAVNTLDVDTISDAADGDTTSISALLADKGSDGFISLREAITATNNTANGATPDEIHFNIAGAGPHTIQHLAILHQTMVTMTRRRKRKKTTPIQSMKNRNRSTSLTTVARAVADRASHLTKHSRWRRLLAHRLRALSKKPIRSACKNWSNICVRAEQR